MPLNEEQWTVLARDLQRALARASGAPEWTDHNTHDPGITVLEALDYALTDLQYRGNALDDHARRLAQRVAERASALAGSAAGNDDCGHGLQRVNYAHGQLLGVDDFRAEQDYVRRRLSRHNRLLHGVGIVCGLDVTVERDDDGSRVVVAPGFALDPGGNEIYVDRPVTLALPAVQSAALLVLLRYAERPCRLAPVIAGSPDDASDGEATQHPTRIAETFSAELAPLPAADAVAVARLQPSRGRWRPDATYKASRLRKKGAASTVDT